MVTGGLEKTMNTTNPRTEVLPDLSSPADEMTRFAIEKAVSAPSVHNTQPWWFYGTDREIGIHADDERQLHVADPDGREMLISCGAALFTIRVALRNVGLVPLVRVLPDPDLRTLVAKVSWAEAAPPAEIERVLFAAISQRRTHRGAFDAEPPPSGIMTALAEEAAREGADLRIVEDQVRRDAIAALVEAGDFAVRHDPARAREQARWAPTPRSGRRDGVPASAYPGQPARTEPFFPDRDFSRGHGWGAPNLGLSRLSNSPGVVALLTTPGDQPENWISAGQALQRTLLYATHFGLAAAINSQPLEIPQLRDFIRVHLCDSAYPQMVLRFGVTSDTLASIRRPVEEVLL
jgi:nitroreductase